MRQEKVVLTADESIMSNYREYLYNGYSACFPTNLFSETMFKKLCPPVDCYPDGRAKTAPLSLRLLESILIRMGFKQSECSTIDPTYLENFIGSKTKIVGISAIDPMGLGPISKKLCFLHGGVSYSKELFNKMMKRIRMLKERYSFKVVVGGSGAWQLANEKLLDELGIDHLVIGEAEITVPQLFTDINNGGMSHFTRITNCETPKASEIPPIMNATTNGLIEVSRGCGRGCTYCALMASGTMRYIPVEIIKESAEVNVKGEVSDITLQSDDTLMYGSNSNKFIPDQNSVLTLLNELYSVRGIRTVSFLHFSFASILASPNIIKKMTDFLIKRGCDRFEVQIGIETGSPRLVRKYMRGKALPFSPEEWPEIVIKAAHILRENGWLCYATLISGFPEETTEDVAETNELVRRLENFPMVIIPLPFISLKCIPMELKQPLSHEKNSREQQLLYEIEKHNKKMELYNKEIGFINSCFQRLHSY